MVIVLAYRASKFTLDVQYLTPSVLEANTWPLALGLPSAFSTSEGSIYPVTEKLVFVVFTAPDKNENDIMG
jgi:hypothetical protein